MSNTLGKSNNPKNIKQNLKKVIAISILTLCSVIFVIIILKKLDFVKTSLNEQLLIATVFTITYFGIIVSLSIVYCSRRSEYCRKPGNLNGSRVLERESKTPSSLVIPSFIFFVLIQYLFLTPISKLLIIIRTSYELSVPCIFIITIIIIIVVLVGGVVITIAPFAIINKLNIDSDKPKGVSAKLILDV